MKMSVKETRRLSVKNESKKCAARFWRFVPHLLLCSSLVAYAALGALIFQYIEGQKPSAIQQEYDNFLRQMVGRVQSLRDNGTSTEGVVEEVKKKMQIDFKSIYFQRHDRWDFFASMFFCCTVFTTVGYGEIYPVTNLGKVACVFYAMVGIPLMLLVILDVGDFLAVMMSRAYIHVHTLSKKLCSRIWSPWKVQRRDSSHRTLEDGTFVFSHDVIREPLNIQQVLHSQADVRHKSIQLQNNKEIFEKILARENLLRKGPLLRALSCPELDRLPPSSSKYALWDFTGLGDEMETLNVPLLLIIFIVFAYICFGGLILKLWEDFEYLDLYYFCFITLTTIGFGDIIPEHPKFFMLISLFIIVGMAIMSMAFKLSQTRIVSCYRQCVKFISRGNVETFKNEKKD